MCPRTGTAPIAARPSPTFAQSSCAQRNRLHHLLTSPPPSSCCSSVSSIVAYPGILADLAPLGHFRFDGRAQLVGRAPDRFHAGVEEAIFHLRVGHDFYDLLIQPVDKRRRCLGGSEHSLQGRRNVSRQSRSRNGGQIWK